ncbi:MAG: hypothetical protein U0271_38085 [Polyangiaceae bacterium]
MHRVAFLLGVAGLAGCAASPPSEPRPGSPPDSAPTVATTELAPAPDAEEALAGPLAVPQGCVASGRFDLDALTADPSCAVDPRAPEITEWTSAVDTSHFKLAVLAPHNVVRATPGGEFEVRVRIENTSSDAAELFIPPHELWLRLWHNGDSRLLANRTDFRRSTPSTPWRWTRVRWEAGAVGFATITANATFVTTACSPTVVVNGHPTHVRNFVNAPLPVGRYVLLATVGFHTVAPEQLTSRAVVGPTLVIE